MRHYFQDREYILDTFASNKESSIFNRHFSTLGIAQSSLALHSLIEKHKNKHIKPI